MYIIKEPDYSQRTLKKVLVALNAEIVGTNTVNTQVSHLEGKRGNLNILLSSSPMC